MAFNVEMIKKNRLFFSQRLGRQRNKLLSGEDTSFIDELKKRGATAQLIPYNSVIHHVDKSKLLFSVLARRVFWQGITERVRRNIKRAIQKEFRRNFQTIGARAFLVGGLWVVVFLSGIAYGYLTQKNNYSDARS